MYSERYIYILSNLPCAITYPITFITFYRDIIEMDISFNCYIFSVDSPELTTVDIYKTDKNDKSYFLRDGETKIYLKTFKVSHLKDHIYNIKQVGDKSKLKLWKVNIDDERIKNENIFTENDIVQKFEGQEMANNKLFNDYFKHELADHNLIEMKNIHIIVIIPATGKCLPTFYLSNKRFAVTTYRFGLISFFLVLKILINA